MENEDDKINLIAQDDNERGANPLYFRKEEFMNNKFAKGLALTLAAAMAFTAAPMANVQAAGKVKATKIVSVLY